MKKVEIKTNLIGKTEEFQVMALAMSMKKPILLLGKPGVGKSLIVKDFMTALGYRQTDLFSLSANFDSCSFDFLGYPDLESLVIDKKMKLKNHSAAKKVIFIDEIDKSSTDFTDALLGPMNEKCHFNGDDIIPYNWELFVVAANTIDEKNITEKPFLDRLFIKKTVNPISSDQWTKYFQEGGKSYETTVEVYLPSQKDLDQVEIPHDRLFTFVSILGEKCSDRTKSFAEDLIRHVACVYNLSVLGAMMKAMGILMDANHVIKLSDKIMSKYATKIIKTIDKICNDLSVNDSDKANNKKKIQELSAHIEESHKNGSLDDLEFAEVTRFFQNQLGKIANLKIEDYTKNLAAEALPFE